MLKGSARLGLRTIDSTCTGKSYATAQQQTRLEICGNSRGGHCREDAWQKFPTTPRKKHHALYLTKSGTSARLVKAKLVLYFKILMHRLYKNFLENKHDLQKNYCMSLEENWVTNLTFSHTFLM